MTIQQRAVHPHQKQERRQAILDAAWTLYQQMPYHAIAIQRVAQEAGLAKGSIYNYFKTKEALFLAVLHQQMAAWFRALDKALQALPRSAPDPIHSAAACLADSLAERPQLVRLLAIWHTTLEQNLDYEMAQQFRAWLAERLLPTGSALEVRLAFLANGHGVGVLLRTIALAIGIQHLSDPAPMLRRVMDSEPHMGIFSVDFRPMLLQALVDMLRGMAHA